MAESTIARSTLARAGVQTAEEILAPSPGAMMRRRIFGHYGLMFGAFVLLVVIGMALSRMSSRRTMPMTSSSAAS